ncbi:hypothetical protein K474DRAFT_1666182 [Panus rudis PR-1116 ss-1]|nr:hypothetical protein K474DRAFT_1666182 [Panus rudis PR-1116 ss-1]
MHIWQVCIIEPGHFDTPANQRILTQGYNPPHPAYSDPNSASMIIRSSLEKLPLRVPLGMDAVRAYKENAEERERIAETFGSWYMYCPVCVRSFD